MSNSLFLTHKNQQILQLNEDNQSMLNLNSSDQQDQSFLRQSPLIKQNDVQIQVASINSQIASNKNLIQKDHRDLQLIYIIAYCNYGKNYQSIVKKYGFGMKFVKNSYIIYSPDPSKEKQFNQCVKIIRKQVQKIIYLKLEFQKKFTILYSPHYNRQANEKGIYFCLFNNEVLIYSDKLNRSQLEDQKKKIINHCNIYVVRFIKKKSLQLLDHQVAKYYKNILNGYFKDKFIQDNILVEVNLLNSSIFIVGKSGTKAYQMMQAKNTVKSMIEGLVGIGFKNSSLILKQQATLIKYLQKVSKYPITFSRINQNVIVILTKDSTMRQLLKRTQDLKKWVGINKNTQIGLYIPCCYSKQQKNSQVYKSCRQFNYDNWTQWNIRYFRKLISSNGQEINHKQTIQLLTKIIQGIIQVKQKFEVMRIQNQKDNKKQKIIKKQLEQQNKYAYQVKNNKIDCRQLQKILKRDVLEDQIFMKKRYNVIYSILEGKQHGPFYISKKQYDRGVEKGDIKIVKLEDLDKGQYLLVNFKISDQSGIDVLNYQSIQNLFIEQLKKLKSIASNQKDSMFYMDKDRKIAHMIKKIIVVL